MLLGKRLLKSVIHEKSFVKLTEYGIDEYSIFKDAREGLAWIQKYVKDAGDFPTVKMLEESTGIFLPDDTDTIDYICNQIRKRSLSRKLTTHLKNAANALDERDPDKALDLVKTAALDITDIKSSVVSFKEDITNRFKRYEETKVSGGYKGIPTPWVGVNAQIQGWVNGTFNVILGITNSGKSWHCVINAAHCMKLSKKVLLVSMESPISKIQRRLEAVLYKLRFKDLRDAELDVITYNRWKEEADKETKVPGDILLVDKKLVQRVTDVVSLVYEYKPDIVIIDGGYRFKGAGKSAWESSTSVVADLQAYSEITDIPWIVTSQYGDAKETGSEKKKGPGIKKWGARYAKEWEIDPDVVIGIYQGIDLRLMNKQELHLLKMREAASGDKRDVISINWDMEEMNFSESMYGTKEEAKEIEADWKATY